MTPEEKRIERFRRRAPMIATQAHLDKILDTFPDNQRKELIAEVQPLLTIKETAEVAALAEAKDTDSK